MRLLNHLIRFLLCAVPLLLLTAVCRVSPATGELVKMDAPPIAIIPLPTLAARLPVIPTPKEMTAPEDAPPFRLTPQTRLNAGDDKPGTKRAIITLTKAIADRCGFTLKPVFLAQCDG